MSRRKSAKELRRDPYIRLLIAARRGKGVRFSAQEVSDMALGDAAIWHAGISLADDNGYDLSSDGTLRLRGKR